MKTLIALVVLVVLGFGMLCNTLAPLKSAIDKITHSMKK